MAFFSRFISDLLSKKEKTHISVEFGKYTGKWNFHFDQKLRTLASEFYVQGEYLQSYKTLLDFLTDPQQQNLSYKVEDENINFSFYQGSKLIEGKLDEEKITVWAKVAQFNGKLPISLLEFLLQENFKLKYSKFVISDNDLIIKSEAPAVIMPPDTLYQALRELAISADSYDDILIERYPNLEPVNIQHITPLPEKEIKVKIDFIRSWIKQTLLTVEKLSRDRYSKEQNVGLISYLLLALNYKIFYLTAPEGVLLDFLMQMDSIFWQSHQPVSKKNDYLITNFQMLYNQPTDYLRKSLYKVKSTFSVLQPITNEQIIDFISTELESINWIRSKKANLYERAIEYIIGYLNFHFALKPEHKSLLDILWRVINDDYFFALGYSLKFLNRTKKVNSFIVEYHINRVLIKYKIRHFRVNRLDYSDKNLFFKTFLIEFVNFLKNEK